MSARNSKDTYFDEGIGYRKKKIIAGEIRKVV